MARVIQRRTPPYLLIVFVILFIFATVLAVLFYNKASGFEKKHNALSLQMRGLASSDDLRSAQVKDMLREYRNPTRSEVRKTTIAQMNDQISRLTFLITGLTNTPYDEADQRAMQVFEKIGVQRGLAADLDKFYQDLGVKDAEVGRLKGVSDQLTQQLRDAKKALDDARDDFTAKLQAKDGEVRDLTTKLEQAQQDHASKLQQAKKDYDASVGELRKNVASKAEKISTLEADVRRWKRKYSNEIKQVAKATMDTYKPSRQPDGKIAKVLTDENLVYINIGSKDRVTEDLRLSVYPYTGIPDSGAGKAVVQVTNVKEDVSECRILQQDRNNPILPGDLVANLVYSALRTYNFVVEGEFDPEGTGAASPAGNKIIRDLVRRYGGNVMKEVTIDTDYVILGESPTRPRKPDETDPRDAWDLYNDRMKAFTRYGEVQTAAEKMQTPIFNGKRFLDMIGYIPSKAPAKEE
jgi:hypothetical protein